MFTSPTGVACSCQYPELSYPSWRGDSLHSLHTGKIAGRVSRSTACILASRAVIFVAKILPERIAIPTASFRRPHGGPDLPAPIRCAGAKQEFSTEGLQIVCSGQERAELLAIPSRFVVAGGRCRASVGVDAVLVLWEPLPQALIFRRQSRAGILNGGVRGCAGVRKLTCIYRHRGITVVRGA